MGRLAKAVIALSLAPLLFFGAGGVAVRQLDGMLAAARAAGASDDAIANKIAHLDLKERLTRATLARFSSGFGQRTAAALELLADRSAFLDPPADEIVPGEPPSPADLHAMIERAQAYTLAYVKDLPNVVCSRIVSRFDDPGAHGHGQLRLWDTLTGELTVRDGAESFHIQNAGLITATANGAGGYEQTPNDVMTSGEFGSILAELFVAHTAFVWHRWEKLDGKRVTVVGYSVPREGSLFTVSWCCKADDRGLHRFSQRAAYEGEMTIDPASGAVLRVTQQAVGLSAEFPVKRTWTAVEYLPMTLGGGSFLLPAKSVTFMEALWPMTGRFVHYLNRSEFRDYHKFAAESDLAFDTAPEALPVSAASASATPADSVPAPAPSAAVATVTLPEAPALPDRPAGAPNVTLPFNGFPPPVSPPQATPGATGEAPPPVDGQPVFRVRRNEIPVRVVVRDEHDDAVGDLRREDFELFDNGKRQQISGFRMESRRFGNAPRDTAATAKDSATTQGEPVPLRGRYVVFVFNDLQLTFGDLSLTRTAAKRAMRDAMEPGTRVALLTVSGIQYLDFTGDLAKLDAMLDRITPQAVNDSMASQAFAWVNLPTAGAKGGAGGGVSQSQARFGVGATPLQTPPGTAGVNPDSVAFGHTGDFRRTRNPLEAIDAAVRRLEIMPGDRSVVLVSPGFSFPAWASQNYWALIDRAARKGIPINTLDARGVWTLPEFDAEQTMVQDPTHESGKNTHEGALRAGLNLRAFAEGTGGVAVESDNDFYGGFKRIAVPPEFTYMLTFSPPDLVPDGRYHKLSVKIRNHSGVTVQARDGYLAPDKEPTEAEQAAREIEDAIFSRDEMREIPLSVRVDRSAKPAALSTTMHIGLGAIRFDRKDGHSRASLVATVGLFDANGIYIEGKQEKLDLDYADGKVPAGLEVRSEFTAAPGICFVRVVVRDQDGHMSSINRTAEVR
jgi:VWFA-related protein